MKFYCDCDDYFIRHYRDVRGGVRDAGEVDAFIAAMRFQITMAGVSLRVSRASYAETAVAGYGGN